MEPLVFYDENCVLCNSVVRFLLNHRRSQDFGFSGLNGSLAKQHLSLLDEIPDSIIVMEGGEVYFESDAVLQILKKMGWPFSWLYVFKVLHRGFRDRMYRLIARHRYLIFGKIQECPTPQEND